MERVGKGVRAASLCGFAVSALLLGIVALFGRQLSMLFLDEPNPQVIEYAYRFMMICASGYCLLTLVDVVRFSIQGMGYSVFAITAGVLEMIARSLAATVGVSLFGFTGICLANMMAWIFADAFLIPAFVQCRRKMQRVMEGKKGMLSGKHIS